MAVPGPEDLALVALAARLKKGTAACRVLDKIEDGGDVVAPKKIPKVRGQQFEEITEAQDLAKKTRPKTKGSDADPDWEGAKRPKQSKIHSTQKSKQRDLTDADADDF